MRGRTLLYSVAFAVTAMLASATAQAQAPATAACPGNPNALGVSRTVEIDTTGGPGFGFEHFKAHDFLQTGEIVLTFDDGPWPHNTQAVLAALDAHCTKATFFPIGKHATWYPEILRDVAKHGHTIGSHTWSHHDLTKLPFEKAKEEFEMGVSAVRRAVGDSTSPFFRFPALRHPPELVKYMGERNVGIFSTDVDSFDFKQHNPQKLIPFVMNALQKKGGGKGILLMHDFQPGTAKAIPDLLAELKKAGYKIVHMKAKTPLKSLPEYDEKVVAQLKGPQTASDRPTGSVVRTIETAQPASGSIAK